MTVSHIRAGRAVTGLVVAPLVAAGVTAVGFVGDRRHGPAAVLWAVLVGLICAAILARAATRATMRLRIAWGAVAVAAVLQTAAVVGVLVDGPDALVWWVLRPAALVSFAVGLLVSPGVRRNLREWGLLLLDGWLIGASSFAIAWLCLTATAAPGASEVARALPLLYVACDLVAASICAGLTLRLAVPARPPALLVLLACVTAVAADATWAVTGSDRWGDALWLGVLVLFAGSTLLGRLEVFVPAVPPVTPPRVARVSQVVVVPGLLAALLSPRSGGVAVIVASSLLCALAAQMLMAAVQYGRLWRELQDQADRLDALVSESGDAILQVDDRGRVEFANEAAVEVFGRAPHELTGRHAVGLLHPADRGRALRELTRLEREGLDAVRVSARVRRPEGWRHLEATVSRRRGGEGFTLSTRDVSERVRLEDELRRQAATDALTGLLSRSAFLSEAAQQLRRGPVAVLFLDLDGFKGVNDTEGHAAGDRLLVGAGRVIAAAIAPTDLVARLGGDEFAVLVASGRVPDATAAAGRLVRALEDVASPLGARIGASIGVAVGGPIPDDGDPDGAAAALVRDADLAMYEAKKDGGNAWAVFEPCMRERVLQRTRLQSALGRAIEEGELRLEVQPVVSLLTGETTGFEALVRWEDAGQLRGAGDFVPLAEETPLVVPLGAWVLRAALRWLATWPDPAVGVAVNVAGRQVAHPGFGELVRSELAAAGIEPARLTLEITERTAVDDLARAHAVLQPLRALGVHVALDDFGTGFSSLGYLARLPVDELKIDQKFVSGLGIRAEDDALVRAVLALASDLGLRVVAEGVETEEQSRALLEHGCELAQGLLYGPAVLIDELAPANRCIVRDVG
jgi:diguanylate cyclase (GGDEF)-like protein/PAS domain S-box-containing protein